jgi:hypothetical protein
MMRHFATKLVADIDKTIEAFFEQISPCIDRQKRIALRAEIIAGKKNVNISFSSL